MNYLYLDNTGRMTWMMSDEADAIERSGRCTWQDYANTPTEYITQRWQLQVMHSRPGRSEPGVRPVHKPPYVFKDELERMRYHWDEARCGPVMRSRRSKVLTKGQFAKAKNRCKYCLKAYLRTQ